MLQKVEDGWRFAVRVAPRASREAVGGVHDGALKVALTAPPVEGAANEALVRILSKSLGISKSSVRIARGDKSRDKVVIVSGVDEAAIRGLAAR